jgi:transposase InsO family protein
VTKDDRFYLNRVALFAHAQQVGVTRACADFQVHRATYYRWRDQVARYGLEILRPRERRRPRMPNQFPEWVERQIVTFALANPGLGPRRLAAQLAQPNPFGELQASASGVLKVLHRHGLWTRERRLAFIAGYAAPPEPEPPPRPVPLHLEAEQPGDLVQVDCFHIGRLSGTKGRVWQYTAIDVASSFVWAQVHRSPKANPSARHATALVRRVAKQLAGTGWRLKAITTDNGQEFRSLEFQDSVRRLGVEQRFIRAGRPQTNGAIERVQRTILEECWRPTFARSLVPHYTALRRDLADYLGNYNYERAHTGRLVNGRTPAEVVYGARKTRPR